MRSPWLSFSLGLNLLLLGVACYWFKTRPASVIAPSATSPISHSDPLLQTRPEIAVSVDLDAPTPVSLRWSDIESSDYPTFIANLRKAGCPDAVLRRIIEGEIKELYARKGIDLAQDFNREFWEIAAREPLLKYFENTLAPKIKALGDERDSLLTQLLGAAPSDLSKSPTSGAVDNQVTDFLSSAKQEQLQQLTERYESQLEALRQANLTPEEKENQMTQLRQDMEKEEARLLSPEELAEYRLRRSGVVGELQQLYGVDFSETEMRLMAKAIDDYHHQAESEAEIAPDTLNQKLQAVLGPARFAELNRAQSASYKELYEVAVAFGKPTEAAAEIFDLRLKSEKQSDAIRADKNRAPEEKQALLDRLEEQVEQAVITKFGAEAYRSYKTRSGRWINSLGRL